MDKYSVSAPSRTLYKRPEFFFLAVVWYGDMPETATVSRTHDNTYEVAKKLACDTFVKRWPFRVGEMLLNGESVSGSLNDDRFCFGVGMAQPIFVKFICVPINYPPANTDHG